MSDEIRFNSKIDLWLLIALLTVVAFCAWVLIDRWPAIWARGALVAALWIVPLALGGLVPLWFLLTARYFLSDETLRIRFGPMHLRVPIAAIRSITPTDNPMPGPALSLDRLRIEYANSRSVLISPEPRDEFLRQIEYRRRQAS